MALADNAWQRRATLCALYVAQGVPWGFMLITLPAHLAYHYNVGDDEIGELKAIILVPWSFKLIWAPLMDSFTIRSMGRRRPWIIGAELMMAVTLLGFIGLGNPSDKLRFILYMYFLHNCFASLQDVCTDALAVDILPPHEQGQMNGLMWGSKLIGKGVGAWGLSEILNFGGLEACVAVQVALLVGIMIVPIVFLERSGEKRFPWNRVQAHTTKAFTETNEAVAPKTLPMRGARNPTSQPMVGASGQDLVGRRVDVPANVRSPLEVLKDFLRAFSLTSTLVYVVFTLTKLIGTGVNEVVTNTLYTQQLDPKWTDVEFSAASGLYAIGPIILGAVLGGFLADRFGRRVILSVGFGGFGLAAMTFAACPGLWNERWFAMGYVLSYETLNAVASVGFLSMAMKISWTKSTATVFTLYMTLSNVSHVMGNWLAGPVRGLLKFGSDSQSANMVSYEWTFWLVGLVAILPLLLLLWVRPAEVDLARQAESLP